MADPAEQRQSCAAAFAAADADHIDDQLDASDVFSMSSGVSDDAWDAYLTKEWQALPGPTDSDLARLASSSGRFERDRGSGGRGGGGDRGGGE